MKNLFLTTAAMALMTSTAFAADVTGDIQLDFTQNAADDIVANQTLELGVDAMAGNAGIGFAMNGDTVEVDSWHVGMSTGDIAFSFGDQGDLLGDFGGITENAGGTTLANPADDGESLIASAYGASVMVGLTDMTADVTDVKNVQATYGMDAAGLDIGVGLDYNLDSEEFIYMGFGGATRSIAGTEASIGTTFTYGAETFAYETDVTVFGVTGFVNGDENDSLQNVGGGYYTNVQGLDVYAETAYNLDSEEWSPSAGVAFSF